MRCTPLAVRTLLAGVLAAGWAQPQTLNAVLSRMDTAAPSFRDIEAKLKWVVHTAVIDDNSEESGTFLLQKAKGRDVRVLIDIIKPDERHLAITDRKAEIYNPKVNVVQEFDLGKQKGLVDQFLLLGFGVPGKELAKSYNIRYQGEDTVSGQKCSKLELNPKSAKVKEQFSKFELCIADPGGYPVRQKLIEPSGNYRDITYSDIKLNPGVKPERLALKLPSNVKREFPQR